LHPTSAPDHHLTRYASVLAALAEGHALDQVLRVEGIDPAGWPPLEATCRILLATEPAAVDVFRRALAAAEDDLSRRISPLDSDVAAWMAFFVAWSSHPAPQELLARLGLRSSDCARLQRLWARRLNDEPRLRSEVAHLSNAEPGPLPVILVEQARLRPSRIAGGDHQGAAPSHATPLLEIDRYAALRVEIEADPERAGPILAKHALDAGTFATIDAAWRRRLEQEPALAQDFRALSAHFRQRAATFRSAPGPSGPSSAMRPTKGPPVIVRDATAEAAPLQIVVADSPRPMTPAERKRRLMAVAMTADVGELSAGPATPFDRAEVADAEVDARSPIAAPISRSESLAAYRATLDVEEHGQPSLPFHRPAPAPVDQEPISLREHARLSLELAIAPDRVDELLAQRSLSRERKALEDAYWRGRVQLEPATQSAWYAEYAAHHARLTAPR